MENTNRAFVAYNPGLVTTKDAYMLHSPASQTVSVGVDRLVNAKKHRHKLRKTLRVMVVSVTLLFAAIGLLFSSVFVAMQFGLLNVRGSSKARNAFYETLPKTAVLAANVSKTPSPTACVQEAADGTVVPICVWNKSDEWATVRAGFVKDKDVIQRVSKETGISARMIIGTIASEQIRFFSSDREQYKRYFEPLKILGSLTQFSYGIAGIELKTGKSIEQYTQDHNSPFYAGKGMDALVAYPAGTNQDSERLKRLTDSNHYYAYLYTALFIKEVQAQWASEGYDVSQRPDVIATLFNIGFSRSHPKPNPDMGGTTINLNGENFNFGELATLFYRSEELTAVFPRT